MSWNVTSIIGVMSISMDFGSAGRRKRMIHSAYGRFGVPAFTFELGGSFFESCSEYSSNVLPDNLAALRYAARVLHRPYQLPSGPDAYGAGATPTTVNGTPLNAIDCPMTDGSLLNRRVQYTWLKTTTG